jgi:AbrB family looped-hinge helix DNA binding protein
MNAHTKIEHETFVNMTSKGQVLIPKELRDRKGLIPGGPVRVGENDRGETVILPPHPKPAETREEKKARIAAALEAARGTIDLDGMTTDDYMRWLRGDWEP